MKRSPNASSERRGSLPALRLDEPENVGTYTIVGVVRDASGRASSSTGPRGDVLGAARAELNYVKSVMTRVEYQSHFISGLMS